ncbi:hypothetical protein C0J52_07252 [Blattella germanica]|nr:hypothetical protein C0J52_07252 [Blattella germanica]
MERQLPGKAFFGLICLTSTCRYTTNCIRCQYLQTNQHLLISLNTIYKHIPVGNVSASSVFFNFSLLLMYRYYYRISFLQQNLKHKQPQNARIQIRVTTFTWRIQIDLSPHSVLNTACKQGLRSN